MVLSKSELKKVKDNFLDEMKELTGFRKTRLREILAVNGYHRFDPSKISKYRSAILAAHHKYEEIVKSTVKPLIPDTPCPIPECEGYKLDQRSRGFLPHWKCSEGGSRHAIAWEVAKMRIKVENIPDEKFLETAQNYSLATVEYLDGQEKEKEEK
jgi:hypothetical protein